MTATVTGHQIPTDNRLTASDRERITTRLAEALTEARRHARQRPTDTWSVGPLPPATLGRDAHALKRIAHHAIGCTEYDLRDSELAEIEDMVQAALDLTSAAGQTTKPVRYTEGGQPVEGPQEIVTRLGVSIEFARQHQGPHRCVDGRRYVASCLVADPTCDRVAQAWLLDTTTITVPDPEDPHAMPIYEGRPADAHKILVRGTYSGIDPEGQLVELRVTASTSRAERP